MSDPTCFDPTFGQIVYYIAWPDVRAIKIGTTAQIRQRMRALRGSSGVARLIAAEAGSYELEKQRHVQFSGLSQGYEFFCWGIELAEHVIAVRRATGWHPSDRPDGLPAVIKGRHFVH